MNYHDLLNRCLGQNELAHELAKRLKVVEPQEENKFSVRFSKLRTDLNETDDPDKAKVIFSEMLSITYTFDEYSILYEAGRLYASNQEWDDLFRGFAKSAATFKENLIIFVLSLGRANIVNPKIVLEDLALIGTFNDWLDAYINHQNLFEYSEFKKVALDSMAKLLESE